MLKVEREHGYFKRGKKNVRRPLTGKSVLKVWMGEKQSAEWKHVVARKKTNFKMKIITGKKQLKWVREGRSKI